MAIRLTLRFGKPWSKFGAATCGAVLSVLLVSIGGVFTSSSIALERVYAFSLMAASFGVGDGGIALVGNVL